MSERELRTIFESSKAYAKGDGLFVTYKPDVVTLADIEPEDVSFLWFPYIPLKKLTLLEGDPSAGKTFIALSICAGVTIGKLPRIDQVHASIPLETSEPVDVLYMTAEDGLGDTLRPRFDSIGGDPNRFHVLRGIVPENGSSERRESFTLQHLPMLEKALIEYKPRLVVIDPLQAYLGAKVDAHRANEVRPILAAASALAEEYSCSLLCIRHLSKAQQTKAIYRGSGSIDFTAAARSVLLAGREPVPPHRRALVQIKSSLALEGASVEYKIDNEGRFSWVGKTQLQAADLFAPDTDKKGVTALELAEEFLLDALKNGKRRTVEIEQEAKALGISRKTLKRARRTLDIVAKPDGFKGEWTMWLPTEGQKRSQRAKNTLWPSGASVDGKDSSEEF